MMLCLCLALLSAPQPPPVGPKPSIEMSQLKFFDGAFKCDRKVSPDGDERLVKAQVNGKVDFERFWLTVGQAEQKAPKYPLPRVGRGFWGYDGENKQFIRMGVGNRGDWEDATSSGWSGDTLTWEGFVGNYDGQRVPFRHTLVKEDMREFTDKYEVNTSGEWRTLWTGKCVK